MDQVFKEMQTMINTAYNALAGLEKEKIKLTQEITDLNTKVKTLDTEKASNTSFSKGSDNARHFHGGR